MSSIILRGTIRLHLERLWLVVVMDRKCFFPCLFSSHFGPIPLNTAIFFAATVAGTPLLWKLSRLEQTIYGYLK